MTSWMQLVMKIKASHKCSLAEAMKKAKPLYKKMK